MAPRTADPIAVSSFKERIQAFEQDRLSPLATRSYPAVRAIPEQDSPVRTPFQRDRDRIVHSKAFRRLKHKTQVFISPEGDHYRTRLTHTLETTGIARTVARALGLNEDLTEAIGMGHDLGHPPFGHIGEEVLDNCLQERFGLRFRHNHHSLRIVELLERDGAGLNLTEQVRDGILRHTWSEPEPGTLEGRILRLVDRIAYINHDIDDAIRAGVLSAQDLPREEIEMLGDTGSRRIDTLVLDVIEQFELGQEICQGTEVGEAMMNLRTFMFENVYLAASAKSEHPRIEKMIRVLFDHYVEHPPAPMTPGATESERIVDWLAGMTDRYAIRVFSDLAVPQGF
jgi:dGTPase